MRYAISVMMALEIFVLASCTAQSGASSRPAQDAAPDTVARLMRVLRDTAPVHQPAQRDTLGTRQARAAVALMRLGHHEAVWPLLRKTADPSVRTHLIHVFAQSDVDASVLLRRLDVEQEPSIRRALVLSLGQFAGDDLPVTLRRPLVGKLLQWYRDDPDAGVHAAIDWLLRPSRRGDRARTLDWGQRATLALIDRELAGRTAADRAWYVNREGHTMVRVSGPVEFRMGSPGYERGRNPASDSPDEALHLARIPRSFAIANREVTIAQFRRFLDANPDVKRRFTYADDVSRMEQVLRQFSPDDDGPQIAVTWYEAAMYCNWLSQQEGLPESDWAYPSRLEDIRSGMRMPGDYLHRTGYRLPTEAEWEYAARAGTTSPRFHGVSDSLLREFAWYSRNPPRRKDDPVDPDDPQRTWPVAQLKPNDSGLFDVYGNVWEWTQSLVTPYPADGIVHEDVEDAMPVVSDSTPRVRRGGAFPYEAAMMRSAARGTVRALPFQRRDNVGFRIARTLRP